MNLSDIVNRPTPFNVRSIHGRRRIATIEGFSKNDPLGVGGGLLPDMPTVYFKGGGWLLVKDLLENYELVSTCDSGSEER